MFLLIMPAADLMSCIYSLLFSGHTSVILRKILELFSLLFSFDDSQSVVNNIIIITEFLPPKASSYELITFKSDRTRFNASFIKFFKYNPSDYLM